MNLTKKNECNRRKKREKKVGSVPPNLRESGVGKRKRHRGGIVYLCTRLQTQQFVHMLLVYSFFYLLCTVFRRLSAAAAPVQSPDEVCRRNVYRFTSTLDLRFTGRTHQTYFLIVFEEGGGERGSRIRGV